MLSPKRSFFLEPTDLTGAPPPLTPTARKVHVAFPYIWVSLVVGTVVMTGAIYATLQRTFPRATAPAYAAATPHAIMYHEGDAVCVFNAVDVRSMPSADPNTHVVWRASEGERLKVFSPQTYAVDGIIWLAVSAGRQRMGYAPATHLGACNSGGSSAGSGGSSAASGAAAYSDDDVDAVALTVWAEARGEAPHTLQAVAWSIINRARDAAGRWPRHLRAVCAQRGQYAWEQQRHVRRAHPHAAAPDVPPDMPALRLLVRQCLDGLLPDPTSGAQHALPLDMPLPNSAAAMELTASIGHFRFYRQ